MPRTAKELDICIKEVEEEFTSVERNQAWSRVFVQIAIEERKFEQHLKLARTSVSSHRNRYSDVLPYEHTIVKLQGENVRGEKQPYINANRITAVDCNRCYISTQGPLENTIGDFWQMIWEQKCEAIVMTTNIHERGFIKCEKYWPNEGSSQKSWFLKVTNAKETKTTYGVKRRFELEHSKTGEKRTATHFHFCNWPDYGVPEANAYTDYIVDIKKSAPNSGSSVSPMLVHCSAGIGRSGTFITINICLSLIAIGKCSKKYLNIPQIVLDLRRQRLGMIQTPEQFRFVYLALMAGIKKFPLESMEQVVDGSSSSGGSVRPNTSSTRQRKKNTEEKIMEVKKKMKESEENHERKKLYTEVAWKSALGIGVIAAAGTVFYLKK
eukprot:Nk52_evm51s1020 gene=Nk52_evmTU51s1020